ncbi:15562_t:CDS:10, partial [Acaulospora morrowiae]
RSTSPLNQGNDISTEHVTRITASSDDSRRNSYDVDMQDFDRMTLSAAKALNSKLTELDDNFTFKRKNQGRPSSSHIFSRADSPMRMRSNLEIGHMSTSQRKHNDEEFDGDVSDWSIEGTGRRVAYDDFTTIDWIHDFAKERSRQRRLKQKKGLIGQLKQHFDEMEGWIVVFTVGAVSGILAGVIDITSSWLSDLKEGYCDTAFYLSRKNCCWGYNDEHDECKEWITWSDALEARSPGAKFWTIAYRDRLTFLGFILPKTVFATTAAYLVKSYSPYASGSGIPEVKTILSGFVIRKFLGWWTLIIKSIGVCLIFASSLCLGKEGPLVHLACCCGNIIPRVFSKFRYNEAKKREVLSAAAAAGVSVAFGAPIGGVLFSLEEASYYFPFRTMWRSFFCAMVAAVSLAFMNPFRTNKLVLFQVVYDREWHAFEMFFFALLGVIGLVWSFVYTYQFEDCHNPSGILVTLFWGVRSHGSHTYNIYHKLLEYLHEELLLPMLIHFYIVVKSVNPSELVANLFRECADDDYHNLCKYAFVVTFGLRVPAGVWLPSMAIGACFGRAVGLLVYALHSTAPGLWIFSSCTPDTQCITPGMYAMVGAAATFGGITRMTVSLVVIMFELTGALTYVLPIMVAVMVSKWVGDAFGKEGIYDGWIRINEYPFLDSKEEYIYNTLASDVMTLVEDLMVITSTGHTLDSLEELLNDTDYKGFPVVHNPRDMLLIGYISRSELRFAM